MSDVKIRYDNKGSEFGKIHRELPNYCGMFDIDRLDAEIISLKLKKPDIAFVEYRTDFSDATIRFLAMFEMKHKLTENVKKALSCPTGSSTWAQMQMCRKLDCRYFIVIGNDGLQPFDFYEIDLNDGRSSFAYTLSYSQEDKKRKITKCWQSLGLL